MPLLAGPLWADGENQGDVVLRTDTGGGSIISTSASPRAAEPVIVLRGLHNYHTHIGDAFLRGRPIPRSLQKAVAPPDGFKHRMLARASKETLAAGIRDALDRHAAAGTVSLLDFREQGLTGVNLVRGLERHADPGWPRIRLLGRPTRSPADATEIEDLLAAADGLGLPSVSDVPSATLEKAAQSAHRARKPLALHASELRREPIEEVLAHRPDLLVHLCAATSADLRKVADAGVPVAICPSSNAHFGLRAPPASLHRHGIPFHFGTDNAMLGAHDLTREAARARRLAPRVPDATLLAALTRPVEKAIKRAGPVSASDRADAPWVVLSRRGQRVRWRVPARVIAARDD